MGTQCETQPLQFPCPWRDWVIQSFIDHRLSTVALLLAAFTWVFIWGFMRTSIWSAPMAEDAQARHAVQADGWRAAARVTAWLGLFVSCCGLVLYDADRSALAALLCALGAVQGLARPLGCNSAVAS